ncbi:MAG: universal stress protein [Methylomonas sp.]|nr:universal stress protein [Methylomonas sp.]PPD20079.1 MAG: universal stress protein A [Methylomonas sp.]PPD23329.1 MAG: universal stress protein A [Methylomonas sp.]PPD29721.1 MAG: universal stress protein A [Methylomonas sp.]PPD39611.1 MAG: universal stress protein A [Methylomonas sp.]
MNLYNHVLLAVDFYDSDQRVQIRARQIAEQNGARLSLVHVIENLPISDAAYGPIPFDVDITQEWLEASKTRLKVLGDELNVPEDRQYLEIGSAKMEIVRVADENSVDLIVVGSHGRHGFALLLGSTANGVLHHAKCDVLAVRLKDD